MGFVTDSDVGVKDNETTLEADSYARSPNVIIYMDKPIVHSLACPGAIPWFISPRLMKLCQCCLNEMACLPTLLMTTHKGATFW